MSIAQSLIIVHFEFHSEIMWNHSCKSGCQLFADKLMWRRKTNTLLEEKAYRNQKRTERVKIGLFAKYQQADGPFQSDQFTWVPNGGVPLNERCLFILFIYFYGSRNDALWKWWTNEDKIIWYECILSMLCFILFAIMPLLTTAATPLPSFSNFCTIHPPVVISKFKLKTAHTCAKPIFEAVLPAQHITRVSLIKK